MVLALQSFNGPYMASLGRHVVYITERAVFELDTNGQLLLTEVRSCGRRQVQTNSLSSFETASHNLSRD